MHPGHVSVDGRLLPASAAHLSVADRGFQLGDAVFETLRAVAGRPVELDAHVERLRHSMEALEIPQDPALAASLERSIGDLLRAEGMAGPTADAAVRITISRGPATGRGILPPEGLLPTVVVQVWPMTPPPEPLLETGLRVTISTVRRDPEHPLASVKSTSRADSVVARLEARRAGADDAIFLTVDGYLSEATSANLFLVRGGRLLTPAPECAILAGTTRAWLLRWAAQVGLEPTETLLTTRDLAEADEAFLSSSIAGVLPVTRLDAAPIGSGRPGPWTRRARADREASFVRIAAASPTVTEDQADGPADDRDTLGEVAP